MKAIISLLALILATQAQAIQLPAVVNTPSESQTEIVLNRLEAAIGQNLSDDQAHRVVGAVETLIEIAMEPKEVVATTQTYLICAGGSAALYLKARLAACVDFSTFKVYYIQGAGILAWGASAHVFLMGVNHDVDQPLRPKFTQVLGGGGDFAQIAKLMTKLSKLSRFFPVGAEFTMFHSILGNQGGVILGLSLGKYLEFGVASASIRVFESFEEFKNFSKVIPFTAEEDRAMDTLWKIRKAKFEATLKQ